MSSQVMPLYSPAIPLCSKAPKHYVLGLNI